MKKIVYIDMDNVLVDFKTGIERLSDEIKLEYSGRLDDVPGIFGLMDPMPFKSWSEISSTIKLPVSI